VDSAQLNGTFTYPSTGRTSNQLATLEHIGVLSLPGTVDTLPRTRRYDDATASLEERARSYFHGNCMHCHQPGGPALGNMDLRITTPFASQNVCDVQPTQGNLGVNNARLIQPGDPALSIVSLRMHRLGAGQMPPLGRSLVDDQGTALVDQFITGLAACP
jgi:mono/diheme cytochrome c family protein